MHVTIFKPCADAEEMSMFVIRPDNSFEVKPYKKSSLESLQKEVGGSITLVNAGKFIGFVDDEGALKESQHQNALAAFVLDYLGNDLRCFIARMVRGPLVIVGPNERGLNGEQIEAFKKLCEFSIKGDIEDVEQIHAELTCLEPSPLCLSGKVKKTKKRAKPYSRKPKTL